MSDLRRQRTLLQTPSEYATIRRRTLISYPFMKHIIWKRN